MAPEERKQLVEDVDRVLLRYLSEMVGDPVSQALEYLAVMRRGLDVERLIYIWGGERQRAKEALEHLLRLSFIKSRPDGTLLLHDEAYTIYQQQFVREPEEQRRIQRERHIQLFTRLVTYSRDRASHLTQEIRKEQAKIEETPVDTMKAGYLNLKQRLQDYRRERRRMYAEQIHYSLYLDPPHGFARDYFQLAEQAFAASDPELDILLQSEIELFFFGVRPDLNQQQANVADNDWELLRFAVVHDRVSRWIKRITQLSDLSSAQHLAARANERHETLINDLYGWTRKIRETAEGRVVSQLFAREWQACGDFAALIGGEQIDTTLERLEEIIRYFEGVLTVDKQQSNELQPARQALRQRLLNVLAQCLLYTGYGYATRNDFKQALNYYRQADAILRRTKFAALHAEVQNDMSRVLSELGDSNTALTICQEALQMRTTLGFDYLIALSRNTLALIHIKNARPTSARYYAETALSLCRQLNNPRGIGLALRQLAEAKRRIWNLTADEVRRDAFRLGDLSDKVNLLSEAAEHIGEAEYIFKEVFRERPRLIDAQIEAGCLYREWATFLGQGPGEAYFDRAVGYLDNAILAAKDDYPQHYVTALVNKAWLYGHMGLPADALRVAEEAVAAAPSEYRFKEDTPLDLKATQNVVYNPLAGGPPAVINHTAVARLDRFVAPRPLADEVDQQLSAARLVMPFDEPPGVAQSLPDTLTIWFHVTNACNLDCPYCYIRKSSARMALDDGMRAVDAVMATAVRRGFRTVKLKYAGGEAALHYRMVQRLHAYAQEQAERHGIVLRAVLLSNGTVMPVALADWLATANVRLMVSVDGVGEAHNIQRPWKQGGPGAFAALERNLTERLLPRRIRPDICITITGRTAHTLSAAVEWTLDHDLPFSLNFYRENDQSATYRDLRYDEAQIIAGMLKAYAAIERRLPDRPLLDGLLDRVQAHAHTHTCGVGSSYAVVTHEGRIAQCQMDLQHAQPLNSGSDVISLVASGPLHPVSVDEKAGCRNCRWRYRCAGGCPIVTLRATGRTDIKSPNCAIYQALMPAALRLEGLRILKTYRSDAH